MGGKFKAYYATKAAGQFFGDDAGDGPPFHVEGWTFVMWLRQDGPGHGGNQQHITGFYDFPEPARTQ